MKLDTKALRYLTQDDWRVLTAVEQGSRNHEVVPTPLIGSISGQRGGVHRFISNLAKVGLIAKVKNASYDGYRLTYGGLDYLAMNTYSKQNTIFSVGNQIGVGKESDIIVVASPSGVQRVLKIHRLGRISFRSVKANRDYLRNRSSASWMYMSRLAAMKEFAFMKALSDNGFVVPEPISQNRHTIVMSLIDAFPMRTISDVPQPEKLYSELLNMILRLAKYGLIHGDFNEFNILIEEKEEPSDSSDSDVPPKLTLKPVLIDFPQMVSIDHANAEYYFDRDVNCIKRFFERRFHFTSDEPGPFFKDAIKSVGEAAGARRLDIEVEASGFSKKMAKELETYMREVGVDGDGDAENDAAGSGEDEDEENGEEDERTDLAGNDEVPAESRNGEADDGLQSGMTVLQINDDTPAVTRDDIQLPAKAAPSKSRSSAKAASGWAI